jgi:Zn-dependent protease
MGSATIIGLIAIFGTLAISATLHEFMHGYVAHRLGDNTAKYSGRLTLNPLAHVDPFATVLLPIILFIIGAPLFAAAKPVPFNPSNFRNGETGLAMVSLAGPLTNLVLAIIGGIVFQALSLGIAVTYILAVFILLNIGLFVFNMIPFPPLDGSRLLYVLSPESVRRFMQTIESGGIFSIGILILILFPLGLGSLLGEAITVVSQWITGTDLPRVLVQLQQLL